jgi:hypothetical protein
MRVVKNGNNANHKGLVIARLHHHLVQVPACHHPLAANLWTKNNRGSQRNSIYL